MHRFILTFCLFLSLATSALAQTQVNLFYTKMWEITERSRATYFRNCIISTDEYWHFIGPVRDFYAEDGKLYMTGNYSGTGEKQGEFIFYYKNGQVKSKGSFDKNKRVGLWEYWFENGQKKQEFVFEDEQPLIKNSWSKNGKEHVVNGEGNYNGIYYGPKGEAYLLKGPVSNFKKQGTWTGFMLYDNEEAMRKNYEETFVNNKFMGGTMFRINKTPIPDNTEQSEKHAVPYSIRTSEMFLYDPIYFGAKNDEGMVNYVFNHIKPAYSAKKYEGKNNSAIIESILKQHVDGPNLYLRLNISATITSNGTLTDIEIPKTRYPQIENDLKVVLSQITDLSPEVKNGQPVNTVKFDYVLKFNPEEVLIPLHY